jgi:hypothetical protein
MRNSRRLVGGLVLALMMSTALSADTGAPGGASKGTCGFLQGIVWKVGSPAILTAVFERVFECDLE